MGKEKALVAMSGGVDSSAAALLLLRRGYAVEGVTFLLWEEEPGREPQGVEDAREVCRCLGIPHRVQDHRELFRSRVVEPFVRAYQEGRTPNPCILCNRHVKFGAFARAARELGAERIATGHYARTAFDPELGRWTLSRGADPAKDQSYVLYGLTQEELSILLLPCGELSKGEIRRLAEEAGLPAAHKPDSQDICFVPGGDYAAFLEEYTGEELVPGDFVDREGRVLGRHRGSARYTVGQRKGLGLSLGRPFFVEAIRPRENTVVLVEREADLCRREVLAEDLSFLSLPREAFARPVAGEARLRYSQRAAAAEAVLTPEGRLRLTFREPQRAPTPGQAAVFYLGDRVACGGTICGDGKEC